MSDAMTEPTDIDKSPLNLSENDVMDWLRDHPDFLRRNPDACDFLLPPVAAEGKGVVDFQHYMVRRLREDRDTIIEEAQEIVETSRANMSNQSRIHKAVLMLLEAGSFEDFIHTITMDFVSLLDTDIISLIVESDGDVIPQINLSGVRMVPPGGISQLMADQAILIESHIDGIEALYGGGAKLVKSQLLLRLDVGPDAPPALVAFGSRNPELFQPGQGTELIMFLGRVIENCLGAWLYTG